MRRTPPSRWVTLPDGTKVMMRDDHAILFLATCFAPAVPVAWAFEGSHPVVQAIVVSIAVSIAGLVGSAIVKRRLGP